MVEFCTTRDALKRHIKIGLADLKEEDEETMRRQLKAGVERTQGRRSAAERDPRVTTTVSGGKVCGRYDSMCPEPVRGQ